MTHLRWLTAGESHGPEVLTIVEGVPAGLPLSAGFLDERLARRQKGYGRGGRMKIERDRAEIVSGVRGGETLGSPVALRIVNADFASWGGRMGAAPFAEPPEPLVRPRPGHADLSGGLKYERSDLRDILERASARETAARVAAGGVAERFLEACGIEVLGHVVELGGIAAPEQALARAGASLSFAQRRAAVLASDLSVVGDDGAWRAAIHEAAHAGDTLGGIVEIEVHGAPAGLGSHVQWDRKLDGRLAQALMSIPAIKGVEIGLGLGAAKLRGSAAHDPIAFDPSTRTYPRGENRAGGMEGGISNGMPLIMRAAMKPISTLKRALPSVDVRTKQTFAAAHERSDVCAVAAASVVCQAMVALVVADALLEKTGGDSMREVIRNLEAFQAAQRAW